MADKKAPSRSKTQIEADIQAAVQRLSANLSDLIDQIHPVAIKRRKVEEVKQNVRTEMDAAKAQVVNPDGSLRVNRLAVIGGAVAGLVTFVVMIRFIARKARRG